MISKAPLLVCLVELMNNLRLSSELMEYPPAQQVVDILPKIIGWGAGQNDMAVSATRFPASSNITEDCRRLHRLYLPGMMKQNFLLTLIMFEINATFTQYLEEYQKPAVASGHASPVTPVISPREKGEKKARSLKNPNSHRSPKSP